MPHYEGYCLHFSPPTPHHHPLRPYLAKRIFWVDGQNFPMTTSFGGIHYMPQSYINYVLFSSFKKSWLVMEEWWGGWMRADGERHLKHHVYTRISNSIAAFSQFLRLYKYRLVLETSYLAVSTVINAWWIHQFIALFVSFPGFVKTYHILKWYCSRPVFEPSGKS